MNKTVRDKLVSMREEKYREFSSALIPGCENILGVRVPVIRKYAKEILKENTDWQKILEEDDVYFEETMLRGFIIGMATLKEDDVELAKEKLAEFVTYIDNWSINDSFCNAFKIAGKHGEDFIAEIEKMVKSKKEYEARAGLILLLNHYVKVDMAGKKTVRKRSVEICDITCEYKGDIEKGRYTDKILQLVDRDFSENGYYTQMAAGWLIAELFVTYPKAVWNYLKDKEKLKIDDVSYKKAVRKICESKTPSKEVKECISRLCS